MFALIAWAFFSADVDSLRSPHYVVREAAEARLTKYSYVTWPLCDKPFTDVEQARRAKRVCDAQLKLVNTRSLPHVFQSSPPWWSLYFDDLGVPYEFTGGWYSDIDGCYESWLTGEFNVLAFGMRPHWFYSLAANYLGEPHITQCGRHVWSIGQSKDATAAMGRDLLRLGLPRSLVERWLCSGK